MVGNQLDGGQLDERGVVAACPACGRKNRLTYEHLGNQVRCGSCKQLMAPPSSPLEVPTTGVFDRLLATSSLPFIVDYWAPWCGPCRMVAPELEAVAARQAGRLMVVKVNTDQLTDLAERYAIRSIPTLAVYAGGREITRTTGVRPAADIEAFVSQALRAGAPAATRE